MMMIHVKSQVPRGRKHRGQVLHPGGYSMPDDVWARMVLALGPEIIEAAIADGTIIVMPEPGAPAEDPDTDPAPKRPRKEK